VSAHTFVEATDPKAGSMVRVVLRFVLIRFTELAEPTFGGIEVFDPDRNRVDIGETEHASVDRTAIRVGLEQEGPPASEVHAPEAGKLSSCCWGSPDGSSSSVSWCRGDGGRTHSSSP
jgi:hypothetical protein